MGQLVLARKVLEQIIIGEATLTIVEIRGGRAICAIEAPPHVKILRGELLRFEPPLELKQPPRPSTGE